MGYFAGCYQLRTLETSYLVQLQTKRANGAWAARLVDRGNSPGNSWSWMPTDSAHFLVQWEGIDGALTYRVKHEPEGLVAEETFTSGNTHRDKTVPAEVRRVRCETIG